MSNKIFKKIQINLNDFRPNGVSVYNNSGAGFQYSFENTNDEILGNICLPEDYKGENIKIEGSFALYSTTPNSGDKIKFEVDYFFFKAGDGSNPYTSKDGTISQEFDVSSISPDSEQSLEIETAMSGKVGADTLQLTIRRVAASQEYSSSVDLQDVHLKLQ